MKPVVDNVGSTSRVDLPVTGSKINQKLKGCLNIEYERKIRIRTHSRH